MKRLTLVVPYAAVAALAVALAIIPQAAGAQATTMPPYSPTPSTNPMATATVNPMPTATANSMESTNPTETVSPTASPLESATTNTSSTGGGGHGSWGLLGLLGLIGLIGLRGSSRNVN